MISKLKVSIITASYESEFTISDTLKSVNSQTYPHIEQIIIDAKSKDETLNIVKKIGNRVIHITCESDNGIFDAYNKGLSVANGEIIGILNSDDFYAHSEVISNVIKIFEKNTEVEAVYADLVYVDKNNIAKIVRYWKSKIYKKGDFARGFALAHPTLFLRKSVYERVGKFNSEFKLSGDYEFTLRTFHKYGVISVYMPEIIVCMRTGGATGGTFNSIKKQNLEVLEALNKHKVYIIKPIFFMRKLFDRLIQRLRAPFVSFTKVVYD